MRKMFLQASILPVCVVKQSSDEEWKKQFYLVDVVSVEREVVCCLRHIKGSFIGSPTLVICVWHLD